MQLEKKNLFSYKEVAISQKKYIPNKFNLINKHSSTGELTAKFWFNWDLFKKLVDIMGPRNEVGWFKKLLNSKFKSLFFKTICKNVIYWLFIYLSDQLKKNASIAQDHSTSLRLIGDIKKIMAWAWMGEVKKFENHWYTLFFQLLDSQELGNLFFLKYLNIFNLAKFRLWLMMLSRALKRTINKHSSQKQNISIAFYTLINNFNRYNLEPKSTYFSILYITFIINNM